MDASFVCININMIVISEKLLKLLNYRFFKERKLYLGIKITFMKILKGFGV